MVRNIYAAKENAQDSSPINSIKINFSNNKGILN